MEEKILNIILDGRSDSALNVVKKITAHVFEFIGWLHYGTDDTWEIGEEDLWWVKDLGESLPIEEVYQYWLTKIHE